LALHMVDESTLSIIYDTIFLLQMMTRMNYLKPLIGAGVTNQNKP